MFPNRGSAMASPADDLIENDPARLRAGLVRLTLLAVLGGAATGLVATAFRMVQTEGAAAAAALRAPIFEDKVVDMIFAIATVTERDVTKDELQDAVKKLEDLAD